MLQSLAHAKQDRFSFLLRARYQVLIGIVLAILLPMGFSLAFLGTQISDPNQYNTAIGGILALVLGFIAFRRLHVFPGITAGGYVVACLSGSFCILAIALVLLRIDYSRVQLTISYLLTVSVFTYIHLRIDVRRTKTIGVIPGGATEDLPKLPKVTWFRLGKALAAAPPLDGVVVDLRFDHSKEWDDRIAQFALQGTPVFHVKQAIEQLTGKVELEHLSENTLGSLNPNNIYLKIKGAVDALAALFLLLLLAPVLLIIAASIRLDSPGPALFRQRRVGFRARPFTVYKFRTMRVDSESVDGEQARLKAITVTNDPRITRLGAMLRRTRLDELPQLINILRGEMSMIGPRPEAQALSEWYAKEISFYHYRHIIKPGLTGWAQVNQGHVADVNEVREKLHLDFYYVKNFSVWLDILIVLRTLQIVITGHGSR